MHKEDGAPILSGGRLQLETQPGKLVSAEAEPLSAVGGDRIEEDALVRTGGETLDGLGFEIAAEQVETAGPRYRDRRE
jgi:hypothetical protein